MDDNLKKGIILASIQKMFGDNTFNICTIDNCSALSKPKRKPAQYVELNALHCVNWKDMTPTVYAFIVEAVEDIFQIKVFKEKPTERRKHTIQMRIYKKLKELRVKRHV